MAGRKRAEIREADITGLKFFDRLLPLLRRLRDVGCQRDRAGNRDLFFDEYCLFVLLALFNPSAANNCGARSASSPWK